MRSHQANDGQGAYGHRYQTGNNDKGSGGTLTDLPADVNQPASSEAHGHSNEGRQLPTYSSNWKPVNYPYSTSNSVPMSNFPQHQNFQNASGYSKNKSGMCAEGSSADWGQGASTALETEGGPLSNFRSSNIERPQLKFEDEVDNSSTPWVPRITYKPNALKPLELKLEETSFGLAYSHPYQLELEMFMPMDIHLCYYEPVTPYGLHETPYIFVDKPEQLQPLLNDLQMQRAIAIDLEHHSFRSFQGFTCLMQISTHNTDYLIDTLALRSKLHVLNCVFTNPIIVKVFHGARFDVLWLQRDLSLYVINMFDTFFAAKALRFSQLSLSFLLNHFCNIDTNKGFQMADWRVRPLSEELKNYAREDTHYLLFIYAQMRNALLEAASGHPSLLESVYRNSTEVCKRRYYKNILTEDSHLELCRRSRKHFNEDQLRVLKRLYRWRDEIARREDESTGYVLPNHMVLRISEFLPTDTQGVVCCCSPLPPLIEKHLDDLCEVVLGSEEVKEESPEETGSCTGSQDVSQEVA